MSTGGTTVVSHRTAVVAVAALFALKGLGFAAVISRAPDLRDDLALSSPSFGLLLLCFAGGATGVLPLAGKVVHLFGSARAALIGATTAAVGTAGLAVALVAVSPGLAGVTLVAMGVGNGIWDVAVNVNGVTLEQRLGTSLLPRLHAVFSVGTIVGAGIGAAGSALAITYSTHLLLVAVVVVVGVAIGVRGLLDTRSDRNRSAGPGRRSGLLAAWCEPRTLLLGLVVLGFAFAEGSANDWLAIVFVDVHGVDTTTAALAYGVFVTAVTAGRLGGALALRRYGSTVLLAVSAVVAGTGLTLVLSSTSAAAACTGAVLWGLGVALGFPVGVSLAGSGDPARAAARVSVTTSLGYTAFLAGPPLLGLMSSSVGISVALWLVAPALLVSLAAVLVLRPEAGVLQS